MESKTSLAILAQVKAAKEKQANLQNPQTLQDALQAQIQEHPVTVGLGVPLLYGLGGALAGAKIGGIAGAGYGTAKKRPIIGAARGAGRGALTAGGAAAGLAGGAMLGTGTGMAPAGVLATALAGGALGGFGGWKGADKLMGHGTDEKYSSDQTLDAFAGVVQNMTAQRLQSDAFKDVQDFGLGGLGVGIAGRGLLGLVQHLRANRPKKTRTGPAHLPMPFPAAPEKVGSFVAGDMASTKDGIPWYGPASMLGLAGGAALGWKGMDMLINRQRRKKMESELSDAREQFHDALMSQYSKPVEIHPELMNKNAEDANTMVKVGQALDELYDTFLTAMQAQDTNVKQAMDLPNMAGQLTNRYGMYAGATGLLAGALVYDKLSKRSRRAVLESALKKRQRRRFMQQPTEIYAQPEPMAVPGSE